MKIYDLVIVGSGPAGLSAAIYAARAALDFIVIESAPMSGGQVLTTADVDNYLGFPNINGFDLAERMRGHADKLGTVFENHNVSKIEDRKTTKVLVCEDGIEISARAVIVASGANSRKLGVPGEDKYKGRGVSYCAVCDGNFYRDRTVVVVGGGDTAMEDALYLSRLCKKVHVVHRRNTFRAAGSYVKRVQEQRNVECIMEAQVVEIQGGLKVDKVLLKTSAGEREIMADGVFIAVGVTPRTESLKGLVEMDEAGYVLAGENCATTCEGIFAIGDIRKKPLRQIITAAADGANAVNSVVDYLQ